MTHRATIVIPVWNTWPLTRACLDTLRATLRNGDEVVVVDNGSEDDTGPGLTAYPWVTVITNPSNRGFAAACNQGAAAATADVVVFLNNDTLLPPGWLDALCLPFQDRTVGATGPRSNCVSGPQLIETVGYDARNPAGLFAWAGEWMAANAGRVEETRRLVGFCLAVRRPAFSALGGFDEGFGIGGFEDDDLCARLTDDGWRLLITHGSFVHHIGHQTFDANGLDWMAIQLSNQPRFVDKRLAGAPLLTGFVTALNAAASLPACLDSLTGLVDEVVVYDGGSTDATVTVARAAGATVVEGSRLGRHEALHTTRGHWVLALDADERIDCDPVLFRHLLSVGALPDTVGIVLSGVVGPSGDGRAAFRLGRRQHLRWAAPGGSELATTSEQWQAAPSVMPTARLTRSSDVAALLGALTRPGAAVDAVANLLSPGQLSHLQPGVAALAPDTADALLERLWERYPGQPDLAAAVAAVGPALGLDRGLDWSVRLRAHGQPTCCPLLATVASTGTDPLVRLQAAALAVAAFGDDIDEGSARSIGRALPPAVLADALAETVDTAPELVPLVAAGAVIGSETAATLADALDQVGASEAAGAMRHLLPTPV